MSSKKSKLILVERRKIYTDEMMVEFRLKGKINNVYNSKDYNKSLFVFYRTKSKTEYSFFNYRRQLYEESYFEKIYDICESNSIAVLNLKDEDNFIKKLAWYKLKYNDEIPVIRDIVTKTQKERYKLNRRYEKQ